MYNSAPDTLKHIGVVRAKLLNFIEALRQRGINHDRSKLSDPEKSYFDEYTPKLADTTYGSDEYKKFLKEMKPGLDHHYANNSHHPEHYEDGIDGMDLVDLVEMWCDWLAAVERHDNGDIMKSIDHNKGRFNMAPQLVNIFKNTAIRMNNE